MMSVLGIVLIFFIFLYLFSLIELIESLFSSETKSYKIQLFAHATVIITGLIIFFNRSDWFKAPEFLVATFNDGLTYYELILRKDGTYEDSVQVIGIEEFFKGKYKIENNLLKFSNKSYDLSTIPDTVLLDYEKNAIFFKKKM